MVLIETLEDILNEEEKKEYEKILNDTPFMIEDFYLTDNDIFKCLLKKDYYSNLLFDYSLDMIKFILPQATNIYFKIEEMIENKEWEKLFSTFLEKRDLLNSFFDLYYEIEEEILIEVFKIVYSRSEYGFELISEDFLETIKELNQDIERNEEIITIYRGVGSKSQRIGYSWTTDKKVAEWFSKRFNSNGEVLEAKTKREDIVMYIDDRSEHEVIVLPSKLIDIKRIK